MEEKSPGCRVGAAPGLKQIILHHCQKLLWKARPFRNEPRPRAAVETPWCPGGGAVLSRPLGLGPRCPAGPAFSRVAHL